MNQCSQPSWSKLNTAAMLHDVFSVTKTHYVLVIFIPQFLFNLSDF